MIASRSGGFVCGDIRQFFVVVGYPIYLCFDREHGCFELYTVMDGRTGTVGNGRVYISREYTQAHRLSSLEQCGVWCISRSHQMTIR